MSIGKYLLTYLLTYLLYTYLLTTTAFVDFRQMRKEARVAICRTSSNLACWFFLYAGFGGFLVVSCLYTMCDVVVMTFVLNCDALEPDRAYNTRAGFLRHSGIRW